MSDKKGIIEILKSITSEEWDILLHNVLIFWLPGKNGEDGKDGKDWLTWPKWDTGDIWPRWPQWLNGEKWEKWEQGERGLQWEQWVQWPIWIQWPKGDNWQDGKDGVNGIDAIWEISFSIDGKEWKDTMVEWTRYIRFVINGKITAIDFYKFIKQ